MRLSFVIPAYNEEHYIADCLAAIVGQAAATKGQNGKPYGIEIVVVNNASTDGTETVVKNFIKNHPEIPITLVTEKEKGLVRARRAGFLASTGDLVANIDADARITPGWIKRVMDEFAKDPKLVTLSGPFIYYDAPWKIRFSTRLFYYVGYGFYLLNRFVFRVGSMVQGGNFVVRRDALEKIGGFDVRLSFYGEDTDIARRMNKVGRVKFTFKLPALSSGRRLAKEGGFTTGLRYATNFFWITFLKRPFTEQYEDIRLENNNAVVYAPTNKKKEWLIGTTFAIILAAILGGGAYLAYRLFEIGAAGIFK